MKNIFKHKIILAGICAVALMASCAEWTETESVTLKEADAAKDNPQLYERYLSNLRDYRNSDHKVVYTWFDNSLKTPVTRAHHISNVPDSVDVISLLYPADLNDRELNEIKEVRRRGTKVIYTVSFSEVERLYKQWVEDNKPKPEEGEEGETPEQPQQPEEPQEPEVDGFLEFCSNYMADMLPLADKYNYDGIAASFNAKLTNHMWEDEKAMYLAREEAFMSKVKAWVESHSGKMFVFEGIPEHLTDKTILQSADYIILSSTFQAVSRNYLTLSILQSTATGVPTDRFIVAVNSIPLDKNDVVTGRYLDEMNRYTLSAIAEAGAWVATPESFNKAGLAIYNVQTDFYNATKTYKNTREAIATMNPSPKTY